MKKPEIDQLNMLLAVEHHFAANEPIWTANVNITDTKTALSDVIDQISVASAAQRNTSAGATMDKALLRTDLEGKGFLLSKALTAYSSMHPGQNLGLKRVKITKPALLRLRELELLDYIDNLITAAMTVIEALGTYGVTQATITALTAARVAFRDFKGTPGEVTQDRKNATEAIPVLLHQAIAILDDTMDELVELLRPVQPDFVNVYFMDRKIHRLGVRTMSLEILTLDANTNTPLAEAEIEIVGKGIKRISSAKGRNRVQNLLQGYYTLRVDRQNFVSQTIPFSIVNHETTQVVIEMQEVGTEVQSRSVGTRVTEEVSKIQSANPEVSGAKEITKIQSN